MSPVCRSGAIRVVTRAATTLTARAAQVAGSASAPTGLWPPRCGPVTPLTAVLAGLGAAARGLAGLLTEPRDTTVSATAGRLTGIDYLALICRAHRQDIARRLRLADPHAVPHATPWQMVTVVTAGQLLTPAG